MTEVTEAMIAAGLTYDLKTWRRAGDDDAYYSAIYRAMEAARIPAAPDDVERLRAALQTCVDAIALYLLPSAMDGGIGECAAVVNAEHARKDAIAALTDHTTKDDE